MPSLLDLFVNVKTSGTGAAVAELQGIEAQAKRTDKNFGSSMRSIGSSMSRVGRGMSLAVTAPVALAGAAIVKLGADYDQALTNAVSVTGKTGAAAEKAKNQMNALALQLGADTAFSAKDAADAMYDLASSGWDVQQMQRGLNGIMALASATQTDLADATGAVVSAISQFGLKASDSGHVADVFTAAINKSRATMDDLQQGMKYAGPVAASFGLSLEETTAAIGEMADAGIQGTTAGTSLRGALSSLANPVGQAKDALKEMGVTADQVNPATHSLADILGTLKNAGMDTNDAIRLFGREAAPAMLAVSKTGVPALQKLTKELKNSGGTAERTAKMQRNTLKGAWDQLSGSAETLAIKLEQKMEPALVGIMKAATRFVNWLGNLPGWAQAAIIGVATFAAALGPLLVAIGLAATAIGGIVTAFGALGGVWASVLVFAGPVAAVIAGIAVAGLVLYKNWSRIAPLFGRVRAAVMGLIAVFKAGFTGNFTQVQRIISKLPGPLQTVAAKIALFASKLKPLIGIARTFIGIFGAGFTGNFTRVQQLISRLPAPLQQAGAQMALFGQKVRQVAGAVFGFFVKQAQWVVRWFQNNWPLIQKTVQTVFGWIKRYIGIYMEAYWAVIKTVVGLILRFWRANHEQIMAILKAAWSTIKTIVSTVIKVVFGIIKAVMQAITGDWRGAWNTVKNILKVVWDAIKVLVKNSLTILKSLLQIAWNGIKALTKLAWEAIKDYISDKIDEARNRAKEVVTQLAAGLKTAWEAIKKAATGAWEAISGAIWRPIEGAYNKVKDWIGKILGVINAVLDAVGLDPIKIGGDGGSSGNASRRAGNVAGVRNGTVTGFARGGVFRADRGGVAGPGRMGIVGEAGDDEAIVNLKRRTPESQAALREAMRSPNARPHRGGRRDEGGMRMGYRSGRGEGLGPTLPDSALDPVIRERAQQIARSIGGLSFNTYVGHGLPGGSTPPYTVDFWGPGGRGARIDRSKGFEVANQALSKYNSAPPVLYIIRQGEYWRGGNWRPWPQDPHYDHTHVSWQAPGGARATGGGSGGVNPMAALFARLWDSRVQPVVDSFLSPLADSNYVMMNAVGAAAGRIPDGIKSWIEGQLGGSSGSGAGSGEIGGNASANRTLGKKMLEASATSGSWNALDNLWTRESNWDRFAENPSSGAYGIPQALPPTKLPKAGQKSGGSQAGPQIGWGLNYIKERYGSTDKAWGHSQSTGWYEDGGLIKRPHLAMLHANELALPLDNRSVARQVQIALGTGELRAEIRELRRDLNHLTVELGDNTIVKQGHVNREAARGYIETDAGARVVVKATQRVNSVTRLTGTRR